MTEHATTFPFTAFWESARYLRSPFTASKGDVIIGNDVWIGYQALILSGTSVGDGAVIGAHAVVTKDVPPYAIVAGNPARVVKMRFDDTTVRRLLKLGWWNWDDKTIEKYLPLMLSKDIQLFLDTAENDKDAGRL